MDVRVKLIILAIAVAAGINAAIFLPGWWKALGIAPIIAGLILAGM
jgi:hypothetical protein